MTHHSRLDPTGKLRYYEPMRIAIQGNYGSFHHIAARRWFGETPDIHYHYDKNFEEVFEHLASGQADQALVAIENSNHGSITTVYDLLTKYHFPIVGEVSERIHQDLIGLPGSTVSQIKTVYSHHVALSQCSKFLDEQLPEAELVEFYDTAGAVSHVKQLHTPEAAAIGSRLAAEQQGLSILRDGIQNAAQNYTRFLVIDPTGTPPPDADKTSLIVETSHNPGALYAALGVFAAGGYNVTKLQSRPAEDKVWKYQFYIDVAVAGSALHEAVSNLAVQDCDVVILGEYKADATEYEDQD